MTFNREKQKLFEAHEHSDRHWDLRAWLVGCMVGE